MVTSTIRQVTPRKPRIVAVPTSERFLRVARIDARALDAEEDEHGDEHRGANLLEEACLGHPLAAPEVRAEEVAVEREDHDHDEDQDRDDLGDR